MNNSVCIIIAAYNAAGTIGRAIRSALAEPEVSEVIIVDDVSTDDTIAVAYTSNDGSGRLKILQQDKNRGPSAARNRAIEESRAKWIGILDADDFFLPGRIRQMLAYSSDAELVADGMWQVQDDGIAKPPRSFPDKLPHIPLAIGFREFVLSNVTQRGKQRRELGFIKPLIRRSFLDEHNLRYRSEMRLGEDFELYARILALGGRLVLVPVQGYVSVVRSNSLSSSHSEQDLLHLRDCSEKLRSEVTLTLGDKDALRRHYRSVDCRLQWRLLISAIKKRDGRRALSTFLRPYPVPVYLMEQLIRQAYLRTFR